MTVPSKSSPCTSCIRCADKAHAKRLKTLPKAERKQAHNFFPPSAKRMFICPVCGNKRCPKASDHRFDCTHSNEPGQMGSVY